MFRLSNYFQDRDRFVVAPTTTAPKRLLTVVIIILQSVFGLRLLHLKCAVSNMAAASSGVARLCAGIVDRK